MAAPFVAGVVALMLDVNNALTPAQLKYHMMVSAQDWVVAGTESDTGAGRLQAYEAIKRVGGLSGTGPAVPNHYMTGSSSPASGNAEPWSIRIATASSPSHVPLVIP